MRALACTGEGPPGDLAAVVESTVRRPAHAHAGTLRRVMVGAEPVQGPWLGYLLRPDGGACWLALGWAPAGEAGAVRDHLPLALDDQFRGGPIEGPPGLPGPFDAVLVWVEYAAGSMPADHRLLNDLHAMVMLRDLLAEQAT